jgi:hypothetical protein
MTSQLKHCDDGPTPEKLLLSGHLVENDSIQLQTYEESLEITNRHSSRKKAKICYARVSSEHQRNDLEWQIANLRQHYPEYEIVSDIGSGLNWKRRGFVALLERIHTGGIEEVVVTRKVWVFFLITLIFIVFIILLTFLLGPIVSIWTRACGMDLWEKWHLARGTQYGCQCWE